MAEQLISELLDFFPDEMLVERRTASDQYGRPTYDEAGKFTVRVRITGSVLTVNGMDGKEQVSTVHAAVAGAYGLSSKDRFTLPLAYSATPNDAANLSARQPQAISVTRTPDENGPHHEKVYFK